VVLFEPFITGTENITLCNRYTGNKISVCIRDGRVVWGVGLDRLDVRPWVRIPLKAWTFVLVCSSSFTCHPFDVIWSSCWESVVKWTTKKNVQCCILPVPPSKMPKSKLNLAGASPLFQNGRTYPWEKRRMSCVWLVKAQIIWPLIMLDFTCGNASYKQIVRCPAWPLAALPCLSYLRAFNHVFTVERMGKHLHSWQSPRDVCIHKDASSGLELRALRGNWKSIRF
jgi:hypothetical protein